MQVLLLIDVRNLGKKGQVVTVADGFALNALLPTKKAIPATAGVVAKVEERIQAEAQKKLKNETEAQELKQRIEKRTLTIKCKAGSDNKLFGAVREKEIAEIVSRELGTQVEKSQIKIPEIIKTLGQYTIEVKFSASSKAQVKIEIVKL